MATPKKSKILSMDEILSADDISEFSMDIPEWGGTIILKGLKKSTQQSVRTRAMKADGEIDSDLFEMLLISASIVDPAMNEDQVQLLREKSASVLDRILIKIAEMNGLDDKQRSGFEGQFQKR